MVHRNADLRHDFDAAFALGPSARIRYDRALGRSLRSAVTGSLMFLFILDDMLGAGVYAPDGEIAASA